MIVTVDRTQWRANNLLMVSVIWAKRAWPVYWQFMPHIGSSNLEQQQAILRPVLRLLRSYQVVVVGDREFHSVKLAAWLIEQKVDFALRQKKTTYIKQMGQDYQRLSSLGLAPGIKLFFTGITLTKTQGFGEFNLAAYWQKKSQNKVLDSGWYILTSLNSLDAALQAYKARSGIEAMFKDCKSGGYNARRLSSLSRAVESHSFTDSYCLHLCRISRTKNQATGATEIHKSSYRAAKS